MIQDSLPPKTKIAEEKKDNPRLESFAAALGADLDTARQLLQGAEEVIFQPGTTIARQFLQTDYFYLLLNGEISFSVTIYDGGASIKLGTTTDAWTPIGTSAFRSPGRYATTVRPLKTTTLLRWRHADLWQRFYADPALGTRFLEFVVAQGADLLNTTRAGIRTFGLEGGAGSHRAANLAVPGVTIGGNRTEAEAILSTSPFFREFTLAERTSLAAEARFVRFRAGEVLIEENRESDGLFVLVRGKVRTLHHVQGQAEKVIRSVGREGAVFGLCGSSRILTAPYTASATRDTIALHFPKHVFARKAETNPDFGLALAQRYLWLLGQLLLYARTRLLSDGAENEVLAIQSLIDQKATEIPVRSEIYRIPHLLRQPITRHDAFDRLYRLKTAGTPLERSLAGLQIEILSDMEREVRFTDKLSYIYETIAGAPHEATRARLLETAAEAFQQAFEEVPYVIDGMENLPETPGFIAIYNHLACNKQYMLPNNFEFTLDSHFVSAILKHAYGTPGLRVVKPSDSAEFWHRGYYGRVLNIETPSDNSDTAKERFYRAIGKTIAAETPVVIAPEGTNDTRDNLTDTSPGPFHPGAFVMAMRLDPEPVIVPIALANFDKSIRDSVFAAVIKPPIRVSDHVSDLNNPAELDGFMTDYRKAFRRYVEEAEALASDARSNNSAPARALSNLARLNKLETEFSDDVFELEQRVAAVSVIDDPVVFYGSSSFRLWDRLSDDLDIPNALNLGFGGSTLEACTYYFERLVLPHTPKAIFLYAGDNDIGNGSDAETVLQHFTTLLAKIDQHLPGIPVFPLSIKPSPFRIEHLATIAEANRGMARIAAERPNTRFVDISGVMLKPDGTPDASLFKDDMLHMNETGYARWTIAMAPAAHTLRLAEASRRRQVPV